MIALPQQDRSILLRVYSTYCSGLFVNDTEAQKRVIARIAEVETSALSFGAFRRAVRVGRVERVLFGGLIKEPDCQHVLMCVPKEMIKDWFDYGILRLIKHMKINQTLTFVAVAHLYQVNWDSLSSQDLFAY